MRRREIGPSDRLNPDERPKSILAKSYPLVLNLQRFVKDEKSVLRFGMLTSKAPVDQEFTLSLVKRYLFNRSPEEPGILAVIHLGFNGPTRFRGLAGGV